MPPTRNTAQNNANVADLFEIWDSQSVQGSFAYYKGNEVKYNMINVKGKNTSVKQTNKFMKTQIKNVYGTTGDDFKKYSVSYLLTDGSWRSSNWFDKDAEYENPDLSLYGLSEDDFDVEKIMVRYVTVPNPRGGFDPHNDCLFNACKYGLGEENALKFLPKFPHGYDIKNCVLTEFWKLTKT